MVAKHENPIPTGAGSAEVNPDPVSGQRILDSNELFGNRNEIIINHQGDYYRLRITSNQKLILTK